MNYRDVAVKKAPQGRQTGFKVRTNLKAGACETSYSDGYQAGYNDGRKAYQQGDYSFFKDRPTVYTQVA